MIVMKHRKNRMHSAVTSVSRVPYSELEKVRYRFRFGEAEACAIVDGLNTLIETGYEEDDEREEELKWLKALSLRLQKALGIA